MFSGVQFIEVRNHGDSGGLDDLYSFMNWSDIDPLMHIYQGSYIWQGLVKVSDSVEIARWCNENGFIATNP